MIYLAIYNLWDSFLYLLKVCQMTFMNKRAAQEQPQRESF